MHFKLTYRALQGFADDFLKRLLPKYKAPNYSLVCKRLKSVGHHLPLLPRSGATLIVDASGMRVFGEGEWKVKTHGRGRPRKWMKVHLAVDAYTQEILAECLTTFTTADSQMVETLLNQVQGRLKKVLADGAYDGKKTRETIKSKKATSVIPPSKNARYRQTQDVAVPGNRNGECRFSVRWNKRQKSIYTQAECQESVMIGRRCERVKRNTL